MDSLIGRADAPGCSPPKQKLGFLCKAQPRCGKPSNDTRRLPCGVTRNRCKTSTRYELNDVTGIVKLYCPCTKHRQMRRHAYSCSGGKYGTRSMQHNLRVMLITFRHSISDRLELQRSSLVNDAGAAWTIPSTTAPL